MLALRRELDDALAQDRPIFSSLRQEDGYFRNLVGRYDEVDHAIRRIEAQADMASQERLQRLRRQRRDMIAEVMALIALRRGLN